MRCLIDDFAKYAIVTDTIFNIILSICSIIVIIVGWFLFKSYREKYLAAIFGFYAKLESLCKQLDLALEQLYCPDKSTYTTNLKIDNTSIGYCDDVASIAEKLLILFSSESDQVVPYKIFNDWKITVITLITIAYESQYISKLKTFEERKLFKNRADVITEYFLNVVPVLQEHVFKRIKICTSRRLIKISREHVSTLKAVEIANLKAPASNS